MVFARYGHHLEVEISRYKTESSDTQRHYVTDNNRVQLLSILCRPGKFVSYWGALNVVIHTVCIKM
ncbi:hypothetical protein ACF0H5_022075 [Mactra antiquata]